MMPFGSCQSFFEMRKIDLYTGILKTWLMSCYLLWPPLIFNYEIMQPGMRLLAPSALSLTEHHFSLISWCGLQKSVCKLPCSYTLDLHFSWGRSLIFEGISVHHFCCGQLLLYLHSVGCGGLLVSGWIWTASLRLLFLLLSWNMHSPGKNKKEL